MTSKRRTQVHGNDCAIKDDRLRHIVIKVSHPSINAILENDVTCDGARLDAHLGVDAIDCGSNRRSIVEEKASL
jgi:hypothetical protein